MIHLKRDSLGKTDYKVYNRSISLYVCGRISRSELDHVMSRYVNTPERLAWHNEHVLAIETSIMDYRDQREVEQNDEQDSAAVSPVWNLKDIKLTTSEQRLVT